MMLSARPEKQGTVELFGVEASIAEVICSRLAPNTDVREHNVLDEWLPTDLDGRSIDAVLLGPNLEYAVRFAQRIHAVDKQIPILILTDVARNDQLRRTLLFSPFLGSEVRVWPTDNIDQLPTALVEAVSRRRQRRRYQETVAKAEIQLEILPLLQPDATHYLDQLLEHLPIGVVTVDLAGTVLTLNNQVRIALNINERSALGATFAEMFPASEKNKAIQLDPEL